MFEFSSIVFSFKNVIKKVRQQKSAHKNANSVVVTQILTSQRITLPKIKRNLHFIKFNDFRQQEKTPYKNKELSHKIDY